MYKKQYYECLANNVNIVINMGIDAALTNIAPEFTTYNELQNLSKYCHMILNNTAMAILLKYLIERQHLFECECTKLIFESLIYSFHIKTDN